MKISERLEFIPPRYSNYLEYSLSSSDSIVRDRSKFVYSTSIHSGCHQNTTSLLRSIGLEQTRSDVAIQQLFIVVSYTTVLFQLKRDELLCGDGLPLGIATSGFSFSRLSYLWSPALLGDVFGFRNSKRAKEGFRCTSSTALGGLSRYYRWACKCRLDATSNHDMLESPLHTKL